MIVLDTHVWVWWVHGDSRLTRTQAQVLADNEAGTIGVSAISCWEVAKLVELSRLALPCPLEEWFGLALHYPGVRLLDLSPRIAAASAQLGPDFHRDPADQLIVATALVNGCPLATSDTRLLTFGGIQTVA